MEGFLLFVLVVVLLIRWWVLSNRYHEINRRIEVLARDRVDPEHFAALVKRVWQLEQTVAGLIPARAAVEIETPPVAEPAPAEAPPQAVPIAPVAGETPQPETPAAGAEEISGHDAPPPLPAFAAAAAGRPRPTRSSAEWEAIVGGNWLNKLGIFVLIIAIALFLGYSFTQMGPGGRAAIGLALSFILLAGGIALERRPNYAIFARGLLGGGWAGLYFTVYAMQAVDAAKVIDNQLLGGLLLLATAAGMVIHSLRYRVQALTGFAYFMAFATLAITPITAFSVMALVPLAISLLIVAYRFSWPNVALFGVVATYATCAARGDSGAPLWSAETVFAIYWLVFEAYDLLRARRHSNHRAEQPILALNALGFGLLSWAKWSAASPDNIYLLASGAAAAYLLSTVLRAVFRAPASFSPEDSTLERILAGGFEGPITLAAACSAAAAGIKLHGQTVNLVLLAEGELLFLAALFFRQGYPRRLAAVLFAALGVKLVMTDLSDAGTILLAGRAFQGWMPSAALASALFYLNRGLRKTGLRYGYAASALVALILGFQVSLRHLGISWLGLGAALFLFGWNFGLFDFRMQGYASGALALCAIVLDQAQYAGGSAAAPRDLWISLALYAVAAYAATLCARLSAADRWRPAERQALELVASLTAAASAAALVWRTAPAIYLGPAWAALAVALLELGLRRCPPAFRWQAQLLAGLAAMRVLFFTVLPVHPIVQTGDRIAIGGAALLAYLFAARMLSAGPEQVAERESRYAANAASACGSLFLMVELWAVLHPAVVAPAWALFALALFAASRSKLLRDFRFQSYALAIAAFTRTLWLEFPPSPAFSGAAARVAAGFLVVACLFAAALAAPRAPANSASKPGARLFFSLLATFLATALLFQEVSGSMLTVAWGIEGAALLACGFPLRDRTWRLSGIMLFLICVGKLFFYDLRALETLYRILSFFVLGVILVGVSFLYTRFRNQVQRYW